MVWLILRGASDLASNRSAPVDLSGTAQPATGARYIFLTTAVTNYAQIDFFLDNPAMTGAPIHTESAAPYDYVGGDLVNGTALQLSNLAAGVHTITARGIAVGGAVIGNVSATFTVGTITPPPTGTPTTTLSVSKFYRSGSATVAIRKDNVITWLLGDSQGGISVAAPNTTDGTIANVGSVRRSLVKRLVEGVG